MIDRRQFLAAGAATSVLASAAPALAAADENSALRALLDRFFQDLLDESPERTSNLGFDKGARAHQKAELDDTSAAGKDRRLEALRGRLTALHKIDRAKLTGMSVVDYDVTETLYAAGVRNGDAWKFGSVGGNFAPYVISQQNGDYQDIPDFLDTKHGVANAADADAYLARLKAFAVALDGDTDRVKADAGARVIPPNFILATSLGQLNAIRAVAPAQTILVSSIARKAAAAGLPASYAADAEKIVAGEVFAALDRQIALLKALQAKADDRAGVWKLKGGDAYYAAGVMASTTTKLTPAEVHQLGLDQVADITGRIDGILKGQGLTQGSVGERLTALNADPRQVYPNTDEGRAALIEALNVQTKAMYARLPEAFPRLPKATVEIRRVPPFIQDGAANGYYQSAALDGSRPAIYYINLKDTHDWPKYGLPTLTYHEAVPGHHLQISLAQESTQIPFLRRAGFGLSAYVEGWGLYAEQLASEMGVYAGDPLGEVGFLQSFLFRAARLVVDTGIHFKRWTRAQATDYMVATTGFARPRTQREIDRYCVAPGQACSYKVGHTVWMRAREETKKRLGDRFDLKAFHETALSAGALPLSVLESHLRETLT